MERMMSDLEQENKKLRKLLKKLFGADESEYLLGELNELGIINEKEMPYDFDTHRILKLKHQHEKELNQRLIAILNAHPEIRTFPEVERPIKPATNLYGFLFENKENQHELEMFKSHANEFETMIMEMEANIQGNFIGESLTENVIQHITAICNGVLSSFLAKTGVHAYVEDIQGNERQLKSVQVGNSGGDVFMIPIFEENNKVLIDEDWIISHE